MTHDLPSVCSLNKYCLSEQATLYNTSLEQLCDSLLQKLMGASVTSWVVFRRYLFGFPADFDGGAKIKYYKSRRIRWYQRGVQEESFWLPISLPNVGPCQAKISRSLRVIRMMKNTSDWHRKRSFRDLGMILRVSNAFYMACSDKQYLFRK